MTVLEEHGWDLQSSVTATLEKEHNNHAIVNGVSQQSNHYSLFMEPVMLSFSCHLNSLHKEITLDDTNTVGMVLLFV